MIWELVFLLPSVQNLNSMAMFDEKLEQVGVSVKLMPEMYSNCQSLRSSIA